MSTLSEFDRRPFAARGIVVTTAASVIALLATMPAPARAAEPQTTQEPVEEIVITGSRIVRDGYEAPTPVTVVGVEQLQDAGKTNLADTLNEMPSFTGSTTTTNAVASNSGKAGGNNLNLRGLGINRTLVLFDGRRYVPEFVDGSVDINLFPDALISRVDVVTGGASAVYGSDALAGVVNFVLDTNFTGVKGSVQGGVSGHGDDRQYKLQLAAGTTFAGDRGHFLIEGDLVHEDELLGTARDWNMTGYVRIPNPAFTATNGQPAQIISYNVGLNSGYPGGIISGGPLKGIAFGPGGTPFNYNYGSFSASTYNIGGDWQTSTMNGAATLNSGINSTHLFAHASYDIGDNAQIYVEFNNGLAHTVSLCCYDYYFGTLTVSASNPFLPASVAARAAALGLTSLPFGTTIRSVPPLGPDFHRLNNVYVIGAKGSQEAFDTKWTWEAYAQKGWAKQSVNVPPQINSANFTYAMDAVRAPNGQIVCRSNLTGGNPACAPFNVFGTDVVSQAALNYVMGSPHLSQRMGQDAVGGSFTGAPFSSWAGPISVAVSAEWRKDSVRAINDPISDIRGWFSTNTTGFNAHQSVIEGALETVVPLAKDTSWAKSLDVNAAVRFTDYSASGYVTTWKVGATYQPIGDVRLRITQSRDIRAPNLADLFANPQTKHGSISDPFKNNNTYGYYYTQSGNPNLNPENADTTGLGIVYQPSWFSGFSTSVDFYRIKIKGAVATVNEAYTLAQCFAGNQAFCGNITRLPNGELDTIFLLPRNQNAQLAKGIDFEASYSKSLSDIWSAMNGDIRLRLVATHIMNLYTNNGITISEQVGAAGGGLLGVPAPDWSATFTGTYSMDAFRVSWTTRFISSIKMSADFNECTSACPNIPGLTNININHVGAYYLHNLALAYRFYRDGANNAEAFFNIDNLFDRDPPPFPTNNVTYAAQTSASLYDMYGRLFRAGVRFRF